ncbi:hypothetical protein ARMSODRAFT_557762 [Armillaria solidipes]|uniref:Uncharacterized protein n=1 Tax=Armillaria solidipes TaxID=1076256 RepID=A0A2H3AW16_9AGAR|nr:hypothetical protein ARMSODRAFT_557762 [Armillaria solidipes]
MTTAQLDSTNGHHHVFYQPPPPPPLPTTRPRPSSPTASPIGCMPLTLSPHQSPRVTHLMASTSDITTHRKSGLSTAARARLWPDPTRRPLSASGCGRHRSGADVRHGRFEKVSNHIY